MAHKGRHGADEALAAALAVGQTVRAAAAAVGIGEQTAWRRLRNPKFRDRVSELRQRMITQAVGKLADNMSESADVLRQLLADDVKSTVRLGAARANLELGVKLHESTELEERLAALERAAKGRGACPPDKLPGPTEDGATPTEENGLPPESNDNVD